MSDSGVALWRVWFGLFGAPLAWAIQLVFGYALVAHSCYPTDHPLAMPSIPGTRGLALGLSAAAVLIAGGALTTARSTARATVTHSEAQVDASRRRSHFLGVAGTLVSTLFLCAAVLAAIPIATIRLCSA